MDLVTQGILGASTAQAGARHSDFRLATITGFIAGMTPDLDALIRSPNDPLLVFEYHRHFTHSIIFIPFGALLVSVLIWLVLHRTQPFKKLYAYALLGICLAGTLDALTSYGTSLLWPLSDMKIAWNLLAIVDPSFTLVLLVPLVIGLKQKSNAYSRTGLILAVLYIMLALVQSQRAHDVASGLIAQRNHIADKRIIKPTMGNIVLWRSIYLSEGVIHTDAIRVGLTGGNRVYSGETLPLLDLESDNPFPANSQARQDLQRFSQVSDHWLGIHPERSDMVGDVRYAMLPFSGEPLWGVSIKDVNPESHLKVITNRKFNPSMRQDFIDMLIGGDLAPVN